MEDRERGEWIMDAGNQMGHAIIVFTESPEGRGKSDMLQELLFCPIGGWIVQALSKLGVKRFFALCHETEQAAVAGCFPETVSVEFGSTREDLMIFLEQEERGQIVAVTKPVLITAAAANQLASHMPWPAGRANGGVYRLGADVLRETLQGWTDGLVAALEKAGGEPYAPADGTLLRPVSTSLELYRAQSTGQQEIVHRHLENGVFFIDLDTVYIDPRVKIGAGTTILPGTILKGKTVIGEGCEIGPNSMLSNCVVGDETTVNASQCSDSTIGAHTKVGPFAYIRPNCRIGDNVKVGDFVEVKNSVLGDGTKVSHLTYVGDSDIGEGVNLGCGTVTVNYDGKAKARTVVKDGAFVGCNANLIAPVTVAEGAYVAAGSTITDDVPAESLAIARSRQENKLHWTAKPENNKSI
ncbi:MAG: UDP-N-acetylglucosamine diphosphorylase [Oscillospiraceae bacterium]|jgi:bifunctional UDP-N-acetylglucosamine pyrophosphorylase/glucosamine-1-phosphate N-acetyltransferase